MPATPKLPPVCIAPNSLIENAAFTTLSKPVQDRLLVTANEFVRSSVSFDENPNTADHLPTVFTPFYTLSHFLKGPEIPAALEWLECEGQSESRRLKDRPAVRFSDQAVDSGFGVFEPVSKWLASLLADRIETPQTVYHLGSASTLETLQFESMTQLEFVGDIGEIESENATLPKRERLKSLESVVSLLSRNFWFSTDSQTKRMCSPLINLLPQYRKHLRLDGDPVAIVHVPHNDILLLGMVVARIRPKRADVAKFIEAVGTGRLFKEIGAGIGESAETAELLIRKYIYSETAVDSATNPAVTLISELYPTVASCVSCYGLADYNEIVIMIHKLRRSIIDRAAEAVFAQYVKEPFCAVVGDGLVVKRDSVSVAQQAIAEAFRQHNVSPTIQVAITG